MTAPRAKLLAAVALLVVLSGCTHEAEATGTIPAANATTAPSLPTLADALPQVDASGCDPCKAEAPLLVDAHAKFGDRVQFLGVDVLDFRDGARAFMQAQGMTYPSVFDPTNSIEQSYGLLSPPMTQFWDADGNLVSTVPGQISESDLQAGIESIAP